MNSLSQVLNTTSYTKQLQSEEWKSFSAGIRRNRNACEMCRRSDVQLQVHHFFYDFDKKLWEYDSGDVIVLCEYCHKSMHEELRSFRKYVFSKLNAQSFKILNGALAVALDQYHPLVFCHALAEFVSNPRLVENHAKAWGMDAMKESRQETL